MINKLTILLLCLILSGCAQLYKAQRAEWYEWEAGRMRFDKLYPAKSCARQTWDLAVKMISAGEHFHQAYGTYDGKPHTWIIDKHGRYVDAAQWDTSVEHYRINRMVEYGKH